MKKMIIISMLVLTMLAIPVAAFARGPGNGTGDGMMGDTGSCPYYGTGQSTLTAEQQAEHLAYFISRMDEKKALINERLDAGTITQEQADAALARVDTMVQFRTENGFQAMGFCQGLGQGKSGNNGQGMMQGKGMRGQGNRDGWGLNLGVPGVCPFGN